jgi:hypothetical protein
MDDAAVEQEIEQEIAQEIEQPVVPLHYPLAAPGRDYNPAGVHPGSSVDIMRNWLKNNGAAVYGTKQQMYARVLERNKQLLHEELIDNEMKRQLEERREGQPLMPVVPLPAPKQPTQVEREEHELTHAKFAPWCEACILGKGASAAHRPVAPEDRERTGPRFEFDFAHMKADGTFFEDGVEFEHSDVWCTHLVGVDCGNGKLF